MYAVVLPVLLRPVVRKRSFQQQKNVRYARDAPCALTGSLSLALLLVVLGAAAAALPASAAKPRICPANLQETIFNRIQMSLELQRFVPLALQPDRGQSPTHNCLLLCAVRAAWISTTQLFYLAKLESSETISEGRSNWLSSAMVGYCGVLDEHNEFS